MNKLIFATYFKLNNSDNILHIFKYFLFVLLMIPFGFSNNSDQVNAQEISQNNETIVFYGNEKEANIIGGEYIIFQQSNQRNNQVQGLMFVQNSDVLFCFQANYDRDKKALQKVTFAYPQMATDTEDLSLNTFPHQLNHTEMSEGAKNLFNQCVNSFVDDRIN